MPRHSVYAPLFTTLGPLGVCKPVDDLFVSAGGGRVIRVEIWVRLLAKGSNFSFDFFYLLFMQCKRQQPLG